MNSVGLCLDITELGEAGIESEVKLFRPVSNTKRGHFILNIVLIY